MYVLFIKISIKVAIENIMKPKMYILKVKPYFSADKPTSAGPKIIPVNDILVTWDIVTGIGCEECFMDCLITIGITLDTKNPKRITAA